MTLFLKITLTLAISPLTILYIYPIVIRIIAKKKVNVNQTNKSDKEFDYKKVIHCIPLTVTGVITFLHRICSYSHLQYYKLAPICR